MKNSLQFRLLMAFAMVIIVTTGAVFLFIHQATQGEIRRFEERVEQARALRMEIELSNYYWHRRNWDGIQPVVEQWGNLYGQRIILTDVNKMVVADSEETHLGQSYVPDLPSRPLFHPWKVVQLGVL